MTDEIAAAVPSTPVETTEYAPQSEAAQADELGALFDQLQGDDEKAPAAAEEPAAEEKPEADKPAEEAPLAEVIAAPKHVPAEVAAFWKDLPEEARAAVEGSYRSLSDRLAQQGRVVSAVKPSYDVLLRAAQEMPQLAEMTPQRIAEEVFQLAKISADFHEDQVGTIVRWAQSAGVLDQVKAALTGEQAPQQQFNPQQMLGTLHGQIPAIVQQHVAEAFAQQQNLGAVSEFMATAEHWQAVENDMPDYVAKAMKKLGDGASPKDILARAYDMAIHADPDLRAKVPSASRKEPEPDPQKAADAARAASINVSSRGSAKPASLTERQRLEQAFDEAHRR